MHIGDFVISLRSFQGGIEFARHRGIISPAYTILYPFDRAHHGYLSYLFKSLPYIESLSFFVTGIRQGQNIDYEKLARSPLPLPPQSEQTGIVRFLNHVDQSVQRYIRARLRLMTLLEEQKQAIIHQAVTGQIDARTGEPYPVYKSSGLEWVDQVPRHWKVLPLKRAFVSMDYGISDTGSDRGRIAVLTMGHIKHGAVSIPSSGGVDSVTPSLLLKNDDLLFNRTNSADLVAKVGLFKAQSRPTTFASYLVRMRSHPKNVPQFMNLLLNDVAFLATARREAIPSLHQSNLNPSRYGRLLIPLPSTREQEAIAQLVERKTSQIGETIVRTRRIEDLVREYHSRLVAGVVTGKLNVTTAATRLREAEALGKRELSRLKPQR